MNCTHAVPARPKIWQKLYWQWRALLLVAAALMLAALQYVPIRADGSIGGVGAICPFRNLTNLPCPLCGLTRSLLCLFQGDLHASLLWHPLGTLLGIGISIGFVALLISSITIKTFAARLPQYALGKALIVLLAGFWILRLTGIVPLPPSP